MSDARTYSYQWKRNGGAIEGATQATYELQAADIGDEVTCTVTAANAAGTASSSAVATTAVASATGTNSPPSGGNVTVDFRTSAARTAVDPLGVGITLSTFSGNGDANINKSAAWMSLLAGLAPGHARIPLRWNGGNPGSSAGGAQSSGDADEYVANIKSIGAIPFVIYGGDTTDNGINAADANAFVHHYNDNAGQNSGPVKYWVIGNEPDNSNGSAAYEGLLPGVLSSMRAADSSIKISAPAAAYWDTSLITAAAADHPDILSYHAYDGGNTDGTGFPVTSQYHANVLTMQSYTSGIMYGVEECNWHFEYDSGNESQWYDWHNTCFIASCAGQVLSAGGHFTQYADSAGPLGLINDGTGQDGAVGSFLTPFPAYWGIGIWTGMHGQFKRYSANMLPASTSLSSSELDVFACDNGKIVIVNKGTAPQALTIDLGGKTSGTYEVWASQQGNPTGAIEHVVTSATYSGSVISYTVPAGTAVSVDVT